MDDMATDCATTNIMLNNKIDFHVFAMNFRINLIVEQIVLCVRVCVWDGDWKSVVLVSLFISVSIERN